MEREPGLAVYYATDAFSFANKVMGRQSAGIGFLRALADSERKNFWCYARQKAACDEFERELKSAGSGSVRVKWIPDWQPEVLGEPGLLFRPDPVLAKESWRRLKGAGSSAYSLCGVTHTIATHAVMEAVADLVTAPFERWDAVICTSQAVRKSVDSGIDEMSDYLRERVGASRFVVPQLPVIPLGVHCADFTREKLGSKEAARALLGIPSEQLVVLFVGRLSAHGKAHPLPMYASLEAISQQTPITLLQAGWFAGPAIEHAFLDDARRVCPSIDYRVVDGRKAEILRQAWASADLFVSFSDNVQETFGLTPIEAMAAGLPVVVSDWDGYRDTVRDGVDGFRVPTLSLPPGQGGNFATAYDLGISDYDHYCGYVSQFVAVDVEAAIAAIRRLADDPALRRRMGEAGQQRAVKDFDWSVVMRQYEDLWLELHNIRQGSRHHGSLSVRRHPARPDPFSFFRDYPTSVIDDDTCFRRRNVGNLPSIAALRDLKTIRFAAAFLPSRSLADHIMTIIPTNEWISAKAVLLEASGVQEWAVKRTLVWLTKVGYLEFRPERCKM